MRHNIGYSNLYYWSDHSWWWKTKLWPLGVLCFCLLSYLILIQKRLVSTFYTYSPLLWEARGPGGLNTIHHLSLALSSVKEKFFLPALSVFSPFPISRSKVFFFIQTLFPAISSYSQLSNKREVTLTYFEKFHPPQNRFFLNYTKTV